MRDFPQELVENVIDKLNEFSGPSEPRIPHRISDYSTVSRKWVDRTQMYHFELMHFKHQGELDTWRTTIPPDPSGVSRHVRTLCWLYIDNLEGFEGHISALTNVTAAEFCGCDILHSLDDVRVLTRLGSSLVELEIDDAKTTPAAMISFLISLPHLQKFQALNLQIEPSNTPAASPEAVPFFKGANNFTLLLRDYSPGCLSWIPSSPRFAYFGVGSSCIHHDPDLVNKWITSSCETLEHFVVDYDTDGSTFCRLDFSQCLALETLQLPTPLTDPGKLASMILPSISSSKLSTVTLCLEEVDDRRVDPRGWEELEKYLCQLARRFKAEHNGRKMKVQVDPNGWESNVHLAQFLNGKPMPNLGEEADVEISCHETCDPRFLGVDTQSVRDL